MKGVEDHSCPKCESPMEMGWIVDHSLAGFEKRASHWKPGEPERRAAIDLIKEGFQSGDGEALPIIAYRCKQCGFLEYYARPMDWPGWT